MNAKANLKKCFRKKWDIEQSNKNLNVEFAEKVKISKNNY